MRRRAAAPPNVDRILFNRFVSGSDLVTGSELEALPPPARRWLRRALPDGTPRASRVELKMTGALRLGARWSPFRAVETLHAATGFVWRATVGRGLLRFVGEDRLDARGGRLHFRWQGLLPVARAAGADVTRSAAGRLAAETVAWLPQALVPGTCDRASVEWSALDDARAVVSLTVAGERFPVEVTVDEDGRLVEFALERWNAATKPAQSASFGGRVDGEFVTAAGVRLAGVGAVGWGYGSPAWDEGEFFRYTLTTAVMS